MKTKEELNVLTEEVKTLKGKLAELNEEELAQVTGGASFHGWLDSGVPEDIRSCGEPGGGKTVCG